MEEGGGKFCCASSVRLPPVLLVRALAASGTFSISFCKLIERFGILACEASFCIASILFLETGGGFGVATTGAVGGLLHFLSADPWRSVSPSLSFAGAGEVLESFAAG